MLATSPAVAAPPRWIGLGIVAVVGALLISDHLQPPAPGNDHGVASADPSEPAGAALAPESGEGAAAPPRKKHTVTHARATSKRPATKKTQHRSREAAGRPR
jgi:hypothetical protein